MGRARPRRHERDEAAPRGHVEDLAARDGVRVLVDVARERETAGPRECPERDRRPLHPGRLLGRAPDGLDLVGEMEPDARHAVHRAQPVCRATNARRCESGSARGRSRVDIAGEDRTRSRHGHSSNARIGIGWMIETTPTHRSSAEVSCPRASLSLGHAPRRRRAPGHHRRAGRRGPSHVRLPEPGGRLGPAHGRRQRRRHRHRPRPVHVLRRQRGHPHLHRREAGPARQRHGSHEQPVRRDVLQHQLELGQRPERAPLRWPQAQPDLHREAGSVLLERRQCAAPLLGPRLRPVLHLRQPQHG